MIYIFDSRCIIQKPSGSQYYLQVVSANTEHTYPLSIPTASIEIIANNGGVDYVTNVEFDDIITLEVSVRYSVHARKIWNIIFSGRIVDINSSWGEGNTTMLSCLGHIVETGYRYFESDMVFSETGDIIGIAWMCDSALTRLQMTTDETPASGFNAPYTFNAYQKTVKDIYSEVEKLTGYTFFFIASPTYNERHQLIQSSTSKTVIDLIHVPMVPTQKYKVIQGTPRFRSANFQSTGNDVYNQIIQKGATVGAVQYTGAAQNDTSIARYGKRTAPVDVQTGLTATPGLTGDQVCAAYAAVGLTFTDHPKITGTAQIVGTPKARICDLVYVNAPNIDVNGATINNNLRVVRVSHNISSSDYFTELEFGALQNKPEDYLSTFAKNNKLLLSNFIS